MTERVGSISLYIKGPRTARSDIAIKDAAWQLGLKCEVERDTSFLFETVRFKVEGTESKLKIFKEALESTLEEYNS